MDCSSCTEGLRQAVAARPHCAPGAAASPATVVRAQTRPVVLSRVQAQALAGKAGVAAQLKPGPAPVRSPLAHSRVKSKPSAPVPVLFSRVTSASRPAAPSLPRVMPVSLSRLWLQWMATLATLADSTPEAPSVMRHSWPSGCRTMLTV